MRERGVGWLVFVERNIESFRQRTREHAIRAFHYVCRVTRLPIKGKGWRKERFPCRLVVFLDILPEISNDPPRTRNIAFLFDFSLPRNEIANVLLSHIYILLSSNFFSQRMMKDLWNSYRLTIHRSERKENENVELWSNLFWYFLSRERF